MPRFLALLLIVSPLLGAEWSSIRKEESAPLKRSSSLRPGTKTKHEKFTIELPGRFTRVWTGGLYKQSSAAGIWRVSSEHWNVVIGVAAMHRLSDKQLEDPARHLAAMAHRRMKESSGAGITGLRRKKLDNGMTFHYFMTYSPLRKGPEEGSVHGWFALKNKLTFGVSCSVGTRRFGFTTEREMLKAMGTVKDNERTVPVEKIKPCPEGSRAMYYNWPEAGTRFCRTWPLVPGRPKLLLATDMAFEPYIAVPECPHGRNPMVSDWPNPGDMVCK